MLNNIPPIRPNPREESGVRTDRMKPQGPPRNDTFRKSMRDRRPSKEEEHASAVEDHEEPAPSLFDLSKTTKPKPKPSLTSKSTLKESSSDFVSNRPVTAKPERDPSQDQGSDLFASHEGEEATTSEPTPQQPADHFLATADEPQFVVDEGFQESEIETTQPKMPLEMPQKDFNKLPDQFLTKDALNQQQAATLPRPQTIKKTADKEASFETGKVGLSSKKQKAGKGEESRTAEKTEAKGDTTGAVNASIQSVGFQTDKVQETQETAPSATIREIATQIVDRIQIMRKENETHTTITLRHPPILEGATITLTTSDHAKREFNIAFANLSPDAKLLLDRKLKEDSLTENLERKGIIVHMLTTSTQENPINVDASGQSFRDRQEQQQQQQQQRRQSFQAPEEEEIP
jgi:hypothetical protein